MSFWPGQPTLRGRPGTGDGAVQLVLGMSPRCCRAGGQDASRWLLPGGQPGPGPAPDDRPGPAAVAPGRRRAEGGGTRFPIARLPHAWDVDMVWVAVTCAFAVMARSGHRPGTGGLPRGTGRDPGRDLALR